MPSDLFMLSATMIEPRDSGNACVVVADFGTDVATFRADDLLAAVPQLARSDWRGATWPPTLVSRQWWHRVGGYSVEFSPGMSSDNDFSMKLWNAGCRLYLGVGDSLVYHFQQKTTGRIVRNDGNKQFLNKWGMTQSTFDRFYLRRGEAAGDRVEVSEPASSVALRFARAKSRIKRVFAD